MSFESIVTLISAIVTAVATVFIALFTKSLRDVTNKLSDADEQQLRIATIAASAAADSAKAVVDNERPWVGLYTVATRPKLCGGKELAVVAAIQNTGRTPARRMRAAFKGYILDAGASRPNQTIRERLQRLCSPM
jgi:hypothetical protein